MNTVVEMLEKKRNVANEHVQATSVEKRNKRKFSEKEEAVKDLSLSSSHVALPSVQIFVQGSDPDISSGYP